MTALARVGAAAPADRCKRTNQDPKGDLNMMNENKGTIVQVMGPVVDVAFPDGKLPEIK